MTTTLEKRVTALDWTELEKDLWEIGYARTPAVLERDECQSLVELYDHEACFRSRVDMGRHNFGRGDYKYFAAPLPRLIQTMREVAYRPMSAIANRWTEALGTGERYPDDLESFLTVCRERGQTKPTPLLLHYDTGGYNCLHRDLYGDVVFPLQLTCFLSRPGVDYTGGAFLLVEQRPRMQSRGEVVTPEQGEIVIFPTTYRPVVGRRGYYKAGLRHGVSRVLSGSRYTLGVIFHNAR